jgi:hypothetical protein
VCSSVSSLCRATVLARERGNTATALLLVLQRALWDSKHIYMHSRYVMIVCEASVHAIHKVYGSWHVDDHWMPYKCAFAITARPWVLLSCLLNGEKQNAASLRAARLSSSSSMLTQCWCSSSTSVG